MVSVEHRIVDDMTMSVSTARHSFLMSPGSGNMRNSWPHSIGDIEILTVNCGPDFWSFRFSLYGIDGMECIRPMWRGCYKSYTFLSQGILWWRSDVSFILRCCFSTSLSMWVLALFLLLMAGWWWRRRWSSRKSTRHIKYYATIRMLICATIVSEMVVCMEALNAFVGIALRPYAAQQQNRMCYSVYTKSHKPSIIMDWMCCVCVCSLLLSFFSFSVCRLMNGASECSK